MDTVTPVDNELLPRLERLAIVGVGLIGGSIAAAARQHWPELEIVGVGRNAERLAGAQKTGLVDDFCTDIAQLAPCDLVVVCTPVDRIATDVAAVLAVSPQSTLVTDAGSVKQVIVQRVATLGNAAQFVGSHPLAGSHRTGYEHADPQLFAGRLCVVTPTPETPVLATAQIASFWQQLGMRVREMLPDEHDRILAATSHVPHLAAAAMAAIIDPHMLEFAASGFRDTTRIAEGDPTLWTAICRLNAAEIADKLEDLETSLRGTREALMHADWEHVQNVLERARENRVVFDRMQQRRHPK